MLYDLLPGFTQGLVRVIVSYPFDYIRTNLQTQEYKSSLSFLKHNNFNIIKLYKGVSIPLITVPMDRSIQYAIFEKFQKTNGPIVSSLYSSLFSAIYAIPSNYFNTVLITNNKSIKDTFKALKETKNPYRGLQVELPKNFLGSFLYTSVYGLLRKYVPKDYTNYFMFGIVSSSSMWSVIYPLDTIRVIRQTKNMSYYDIIKQTPLKQLYSGFPIVILRSVPSAGIGMLTYEYVRSKLSV